MTRKLVLTSCAISLISNKSNSEYDTIFPSLSPREHWNLTLKFTACSFLPSIAGKRKQNSGIFQKRLTLIWTKTNFSTNMKLRWGKVKMKLHLKGGGGFVTTFRSWKKKRLRRSEVSYLIFRYYACSNEKHHLFASNAELSFSFHSQW